MSNIIIKELSFSYDTASDAVFDNVSLNLDSSWKLGLVARNGKGKTTFLKILAGQLDYKGNINTTVHFEYFPYGINNTNQYVIEIIKEQLPLIEDWQITKELNLLNIHDKEYQLFNTLSMGEQSKVKLLIMFLKENNFLLIDEPTNHLDYQTRNDLAAYLKNKSGYILVSHDRHFLNQTTDHILSINKETITLEQGNYDTFAQNKKNKLKHELNQNDKLNKEIDKLTKSAMQTKDWSNQVENSKYASKNKGTELKKNLDKGFIGAKSAKMMKRSIQSKNRIDESIAQKQGLLKDVEKIDELTLKYQPYHKNILFDDTINISYDNQRVVSNLHLRIKNSDRIALIGPNGAGKSSIIKYLIQHLNPNIKVGYLHQDNSVLKGSLDDYIVDNKLDNTLIKTLLRKLGFDRIMFEKDLNEYSAGQKKKLSLAHILSQEANLYLFDEALNFLDIDTRIQIENMLTKNEVTMVIVEHDQTFIDKVANQIIKLK